MYNANMQKFYNDVYDYHNGLYQKIRALEEQVENLSHFVDAQQNTNRELLHLSSSSNKKTEEILKLKEEIQSLRDKHSRMPSQLTVDKLANERNMLLKQVESLTLKNEQLAQKNTLLINEMNSEKSKLSRKLKALERQNENIAVPLARNIEKEPSCKNTDSEFNTVQSLIESDQKKPQDGVKQPHYSVNEFEIPDFTFKMALLALREQILNNRNLDETSYDNFKISIIDMEKKEQSSFDNILSYFRLGNFIENKQSREDACDEINFFLSVFSDLINNVKQFDIKNTANVFYTHEMRRQNEHYKTVGCLQFDEHVGEVAVLEQVIFLRVFCKSFLMKNESIDPEMLENLDKLMTDHLELSVYIFMQLVNERVIDQLNPVEEIQGLNNQAINQLYAITSRVRHIMAHSKMPLLNGMVGQARFVYALSKFASFLNMERQNRSPEWMRIFLTLWLTQYAMKPIEGGLPNTFVMLIMLNAFEASLPLRARANLKDILINLYEENGEAKPELNKYLRLVETLRAFMLKHNQWVMNHNGEKMKSAAQEYHDIVCAFEIHELSDLINCVIDDYLVNAPVPKATEQQVVDFLRIMYQFDVQKRQSINDALVRFSKKSNFEKDISAEKLIFDPIFLSRDKELPEPFVRKVFDALRVRNPNYRITTQGLLDLYIRFFRNSKTGMTSSILLIDQKLLTCMTPLCDLQTKISVSEAIAQFKKNNLLGMTEDELKDDVKIRAVLKDIIVVYRETDKRLTAENHAALDVVLRELEYPSKAQSSQKGFRKYK